MVVSRTYFHFPFLTQKIAVSVFWHLFLAKETWRTFKIFWLALKDFDIRTQEHEENTPLKQFDFASFFQPRQVHHWVRYLAEQDGP